MIRVILSRLVSQRVRELEAQVAWLHAQVAVYELEIERVTRPDDAVRMTPGICWVGEIGEA